MSSASSQPSYLEIASRKQDQLRSRIPEQWRLPADLVPAGMMSIADSISNTSAYKRVSVIHVPRSCGLLSAAELDITEKWDVDGLLGQIAARRLSSREVVEAFCKRAAIAHQLTRCITEPLFSAALQRASELDEHLRRTGQPVGPLHGLPVSVKDCFNVKGVDSSIGLAALAFQPARENSALVDLLEALGAVVIAKTNVPQTLATLDSCNHLFGRTLNPSNRQLTAGGSSGGEGVLVAMRGSMVGFGTDIGGSIRIPAMCNGIYGFKPSNGRVPYGGQQSGQLPGKGRVGLQAVAGPIARSVRDLGAVMREIIPRAELFGEDCIPGRWQSESGNGGASVHSSRAQTAAFVVGVLRCDGVVQPLPPIARVLDEVACTLRQTPGIEVVDIPTPAALTKCQALAGRLMGVDDGSHMLDLLNRTGEPLTPWLQGRMSRTPGKAASIPQLYQLQAQRSAVEKDLLKMWTVADASPGRSGIDAPTRINAIICPVAPHPVPELDRYNAVGYTSSFVLLDYPAGTIPVRRVCESDLQFGTDMDAPLLGSWDRKNRELWSEATVDRRVYLDSPLSVQVVTPKLHDYDLYHAMEIIDRAVHASKPASKL